MKVDRRYLATLAPAQQLVLIAERLNQVGRSMVAFSNSCEQLETAFSRFLDSYQAMLAKEIAAERAKAT